MLQEQRVKIKITGVTSLLLGSGKKTKIPVGNFQVYAGHSLSSIEANIFSPLESGVAVGLL